MRKANVMFSRNAPIVLALAPLVAALSAACAPPPPPKHSASVEVLSADEREKHARGNAKLEEANRQIDERNYNKARKALDDVDALGLDSLQFATKEAREKLDKKEAKQRAKEAQPLFESGDCGAAFKKLAQRSGEVDSEAFTGWLRRVVHDDAVQCMSSKLEEAAKSQAYQPFRTLLGAASTKVVLGSQGVGKITEELTASVVDSLGASIADDVKAKRWGDAMAKLDESVKSGAASESDAAAVVKGVREALAPELVAMATRSIGTKDAEVAQSELDKLIQLARWSSVLQGDDALPEGIARARMTLAVWVEALRAGAKVMKAPEARFAHGTVAVQPASKIDGESKRDLSPAQSVWLVAQNKTHGLVALEAPKGDLAASLEKAIGWVRLERLAKVSTVDWLPPDDQLKGALVWGPFREGDVVNELGTVDLVKGDKFLVKRLYDDKVVPASRKSLRVGRLAPGMKVLTICATQDQPATVVEVLVGGRGAKLKCDAGDTEIDQPLSSIRARSDMLPTPKR